MSSLQILILGGDGIGPEVTEQALRVLDVCAQSAGIEVRLERALFGGASIDDCGLPANPKVLELAKKADAVILGAVGGPKWDNLPSAKRPERGLLELRSTLQVYANLRPAKLFGALVEACPLRPERALGMDFVVVRELIGGIYFGEPRGVTEQSGQRRGVNTMAYTESEIRRIGKVAFETARGRKKKVLSVDKANVLEVQALWRAVMTELSASYPDVELSHMYVDNCAMQLILNPLHFDVIVTSNLFGDILSDEAGALTGSIGLLPSASLGDKHALYEPVHGSAPDIAGTGKANPLAAILSVALLLEHTLKRPDLAHAVTRSVENVLDRNLRTADIASRRPSSGESLVSTTQMGDAVLHEVRVCLAEAS